MAINKLFIGEMGILGKVQCKYKNSYEEGAENIDDESEKLEIFGSYN